MCDVQELYQAGEKKLGTDESKFNQILCSQSYEQLRQVFTEYKNIAHKGLDQSIRSEMSGDLERGMLTIGTICTGSDSVRTVYTDTRSVRTVYTDTRSVRTVYTDTEL